MEETTLYLSGNVIIIICCLAVIMLLKNKMLNILLELTGTETRARFWMVFINILLVLIPLVFTMSVYPELKSQKALYAVMGQLKWGLVGLILSLVVVALIMISFVKRIKDPKYK